MALGLQSTSTPKAHLQTRPLVPTREHHKQNYHTHIPTQSPPVCTASCPHQKSPQVKLSRITHLHAWPQIPRDHYTKDSRSDLSRMDLVSPENTTRRPPTHIPTQSPPACTVWCPQRTPRATLHPPPAQLHKNDGCGGRGRAAGLAGPAGA